MVQTLTTETGNSVRGRVKTAVTLVLLRYALMLVIKKLPLYIADLIFAQFNFYVDS